MSDFPHIPPMPPTPSGIDEADFVALKALIAVLLTKMAHDHEVSGAGSAHNFIDGITAAIQETILADPDIEDAFRQPAIERVKQMLAVLDFERHLKHFDS